MIRAGVTFEHTEAGDVGLITGKKVYVAVTAGYVYTEGAGREKDFVTPLLRAALGTMGITDVTFLVADGLSVPGRKEGALERALAALG